MTEKYTSEFTVKALFQRVIKSQYAFKSEMLVHEVSIAIKC